MGDPKKFRKNYVTPMHPWQKERLQEEVLLKREYGLKNKKEIFKQQSVLKRFISNYKKSDRTEQTRKEKEDLLRRMVNLGIVNQEASVDEILGLGVKNIFERRLQTIVVRRSLARSMKQARQFIVHRHIAVGDQIITSPSYLVSVSEQSKISFIAKSSLTDPEHPERKVEKKVKDIVTDLKGKIDKEIPDPEDVLSEDPIEIKDVDDDDEVEKSSEQEAPVESKEKKEE